MNDEFIDNVYFTLLTWIIENLESVDNGSRILCDYDKESQEFVLKDVTESLSVDPKVLKANNEEYLYVCDKDNHLIARKFSKAKVTINDLVPLHE